MSLTSAAPGIASVPPSVTLPPGATGAPTTVTAVEEGSTNLTATAPGFTPGQSVVTVRAPVPALQAFEPTRGRVGQPVELRGTGFRRAAARNAVTFAGPNESRLTAEVPAASPTLLTVAVPEGAATGPLQLTTSGGSAATLGHFVVLPTQDFQLTALPNAVSLKFLRTR